jgi:hypothetical protein
MPQEVDDKVEAITENCMEKGDKTEKECEKLAWAIVNSKKESSETKIKEEE